MKTSPSLWEIGLGGCVRRKLLDLTSRRDHRKELGGRNMVSRCHSLVHVLLAWTACQHLFMYHYHLHWPFFVPFPSIHVA
jgi:hypothetical protein